MRGFTRMVSTWKCVVAGVCIGVLAGCGGGGGGGDDPPADITLSRTEVRFDERYEDGQPPAQQSVEVTVEGDGIAVVGAGFEDEASFVPWLSATLTGSDKSFTLGLGISQQLPPGDHSAVLTIGGARSDGSLVVVKRVTVHYKVLPRLRTSVSSLAFSDINGNAPMSPSTVQVTGTESDWTVTASEPWVQLGDASGTGAGSFTVGVDAAGLASGTRTSTLTLVADDGQSVELSVEFSLATPSLTVSSNALVFGGANGRDTSSGSLEFSVNTGDQLHAWALRSLPVWLQASVAAGTVSQSSQTITLTPLPHMVGQGSTSTATAELVVQVNGDELVKQVSLQYARDSNRLYVSEDGVAMTSVPGWSTLTRTVAVRHNFNKTLNWTAQSNQPWLTVTPAGTTGSNLTLTANPGSLPTDAVSYATVTVSSGAADAPTAATIKVALWKGSATPSASVSISGTAYTRLASDPIRPYVYAHQGGSSIDVYNAYTGSKLTTLTGVGTALGSMTSSTNGDRLYIVEEGFKRVAVVDLATLTKSGSIATTTPVHNGHELLSVRNTGVELLLLNDGTAYRASNGAAIHAATGLFGSIAAAQTGTRVFALNQGLSPASAASFALDFADVGGGKLMVQALASSWDAGSSSNGQDIAVQADGSTVYLASGAPYHFVTLEGADLAYSGYLPEGAPYPNNIAVGSDGRVAGGLDGIYEDKDIWVYRSDGSVHSSYKTSGYARGLLPRQMHFSGDARMLVALTDDPVMTFIPVGP